MCCINALKVPPRHYKIELPFIFLVVWPRKKTLENYDLAKKTMIFFSRIFTTFELGIISQQLGMKDTFLHWGWGPISAQN